MNRSLLLGAVALGAALVVGCNAGSGPEPEDVGKATSAMSLDGLFNTGVDASGNALAIGATDPHYVLNGTDPVNMGPDALVVTPPLTSGWTPNTATAEWLSVQASATGTGTQTDSYTMTFSIPAGQDPATATLSGTYYCGEFCTVFLNGTSVASSGVSAWNVPRFFNVAAGGPFVTGNNTFEVQVTSTKTNPTGAQVAVLSGTVGGSAGCTTDADCPGQWCDESTGACTALVPNGSPVPTDPSHTNPTLNGVCTAGAGALTCVSGVCDTDNKCGYANGDGPCTVADGGVVCRSGMCSVNGTCEPVSGCNVDADCPGGWCNEHFHTCTPELANGTGIPTDPPHTNPTLNGVCTAGAGALVCASGVCDPVDNKCGYANGDGPCTVADGGVVCRAGICNVNGTCGPPTGCTSDADCGVGDWCDETTATCTPTLPNGSPVPTDPAHTNPTLNGVCTAGAGALVCTSGVCDTDNECGYANGDGPCTAGNGDVVCRSGACSVNGTCEPAGGCDVDADCSGGDWCDETTHTCTPKIANGGPVATDPAHTSPTLNGTCTPAAGALVCQSGVCDTDNDCGYANGDGPCTVVTGPLVCRSGACSVNLTCEPAGGCNVDADCPSADWCDETTHTCAPKIANGGMVATDPAHVSPTLNGTCTMAAGALVCLSAVCDTNDNACGYANGDGPCTMVTGSTVCRSGVCSANGTCGPASGCNVDADCTGGDWCDETTHTCAPKIANGGPVATDPAHVTPTLNGTCTAPAATLVCVSGVCDTNDNDCGHANGDGPCTVGTGPVVCRSGACSVNLTCEPAGGCNVDADCPSADWCDETTHTCAPKIANGGAVATDPAHTSPTLNGTCTAPAAALVCVSGVCDTNDNECGFANGDGPCTVATGGVVCRSGVCNANGTCGPAAGCTMDSQCPGATPVCDTATSTCVQCTPAEANACIGSTPVCDATTSTCVPCDGDLGSSAADPCTQMITPHCFTAGSATGTCGKCMTNADCAGDPSGVICNTTTGACVPGCTQDSDCGGSTSGQVCDMATGTCEPGCRGTGGNGCPTMPAQTCTSTNSTIGMCVQCVTDANCGGAMSGQVCNAGTCEPGCRGMDGNGCPSGDVCSSTTMAIGTCSNGTGGAGGTGGGTTTGTGAQDGFTASGNGLLCATRPAPTDDAPTGWLLGTALATLVALRRRRPLL